MEASKRSQLQNTAEVIEKIPVTEANVTCRSRAKWFLSTITKEKVPGDLAK